MNGVVTSINLQKGFGFIRSSELPRIFFHMSALDRQSLPFDEQLTERRIVFNVVQTDRGPKAVDIRPAD